MKVFIKALYHASKYYIYWLLDNLLMWVMSFYCYVYWIRSFLLIWIVFQVESIYIWISSGYYFYPWQCQNNYYKRYIKFYNSFNAYLILWSYIIDWCSLINVNILTKIWWIHLYINTQKQVFRERSKTNITGIKLT